MARAKFQRGSSRRLPEGAIGCLRFGRGFAGFGRGWCPWTASSLAAARRAWQDERVRQQVYQQHGQRVGLGRPWGEIAFGSDGDGGMVAILSDVEASLLELRAEREEACRKPDND